MLRQTRSKQYDNISNPSKSSKTIRTKFIINNEQQTPIQRIYFKDDPMKSEIALRARKQNRKISPQPNISPQKPFNRVSKLVADLHRKKDDARKKLQELKQEANRQMQEKYPFSPIKQNKIQKYVVTGDVIRRNEVWLREKAKKQLHLKEERTVEQLRNCTFSPTLSAKKQSQAYLRSKNIRSLTPKRRTGDHLNSSFHEHQNLSKFEVKTPSKFYSPAKGRKKDISFQEYETAKKYLVSKIMHTHIL